MHSVAYVSNAESGSISVLRIDGLTGAPSLQQTVAPGGMLMPLALSPDHRFLYAARRSDPLAALAFGIAPHDGRLLGLGEAPLPASMAHIALDASGRWLFSASYGGNVVAVSPVGADGMPRPAQQVIATEPKAHAMRADPGNRFVFAAVLGGDRVMQFRFDATSGQLTPNQPAALRTRPGAGPRHLVFHPNARWVYLLNELDASVDVLAVDSEAGTLSPLQTIGSLPPGFSGEPWAADLHLTPDGRFLYSSERRSSTLATFEIDTTTGHLSLRGHSAVQAQPRGFAITPDGRHLLVAGQLSHRVGVHAIDAASGELTFQHEIEVGQGPNWIETLALA